LLYRKFSGKIRGFAMSPLGATGDGSCQIPARLTARVAGEEVREG
jgi:hypothetical protein